MQTRQSHRLSGALLLAGFGALGSAYAQEKPDARQEELGTISVTGSALPRATTETPSPVIVIDAVDIKRSGLTTVSDVVRSITADNSGSIPTAFTNGFAPGSSGAALRGLTVNSTLVLIDGRRVAAYAQSDDGQRSFADLNTIPLAAVDRIEVLKDGASSLYGADAIAGVVNVILKHDFSGVDASAEVGNSQHGGGFEKRFSGVFGAGNLQTDRYNAYVAVEYQGDDRIRVSQRGFPFDTPDLTSIGGNNGLFGQPGLFTGSTYGSVTPGILTTPGDLTTGVPVDGALSQPLRACGADATAVSDPENTRGGGAGSYCTQNLASRTDVQPAQERFGVYGRFTIDLSDAAQAYLNTGYYQNRVTVDAAPAQIQAGIPNNTDDLALPPTLPGGALNPNDPFAAQGRYALINYAFGDLPANSDYLNHVVRAVGGLRGVIGDWNYDTALVVNHTWLETTLNGFIDYPQLISDITNGTYNFVDPSKNSAQVRNALSPTLRKTSTSDMDSIDLRVDRSLMNLQGGAMGLALGLDVRHEAQDDPDINPDFIYQGLPPAHTLGSRNVAAVYGEVDAPVLTSFEVDASARYDRYNNFGGAFDPKVGFKWTPIESAALRGTFSRGFRTPSFAESGSSAVEGFTTYTIDDPAFVAAHHNDGYVAPYALGQSITANPNLRPERSNSATFGGVLQPTAWLNASLDYYAIRKTGVIVQSDPNLALSDYFAGKPLPPGYVIITDAPDPQYPDAPRRPLAVQAPYLNANALRTDGIDLDLRARFDIGNANFISDLTATKIFSWSMRFPDGTTQQYAGTKGPYILSSGAGTPRYRAKWVNTLRAGPWETTATIYYTSGMYLSAPDITSGCFSINFGNGANFPADCRAPSFTYVDWTGAYHFTEHLEFFGGIDNLFDRKPPFDPIDYVGLNYNPTYAQAGIIGRFFKVGVEMKF